MATVGRGIFVAAFGEIQTHRLHMPAQHLALDGLCKYIGSVFAAVELFIGYTSVLGALLDP